MCSSMCSSSSRAVSLRRLPPDLLRVSRMASLLSSLVWVCGCGCGCDCVCVCVCVGGGGVGWVGRFVGVRVGVCVSAHVSYMIHLSMHKHAWDDQPYQQPLQTHHHLSKKDRSQDSLGWNQFTGQFGLEPVHRTVCILY